MVKIIELEKNKDTITYTTENSITENDYLHITTKTINVFKNCENKKILNDFEVSLPEIFKLSGAVDGKKISIKILNKDFSAVDKLCELFSILFK